MTDPKLTEEELTDMRCRRRPDSQLDRLLAEHRELRTEIERLEHDHVAIDLHSKDLIDRLESERARVRELEAELEEVNGIGAQCAQELQVALGRVRELESENALYRAGADATTREATVAEQGRLAAEATLARVRDIEAENVSVKALNALAARRCHEAERTLGRVKEAMRTWPIIDKERLSYNASVNLCVAQAAAVIESVADALLTRPVPAPDPHPLPGGHGAVTELERRVTELEEQVRRIRMGEPL